MNGAETWTLNKINARKLGLGTIKKILVDNFSKIND